ncbi:hypothetical protein C7M84_016472 [Penaeus vannamei]|uniref:Uncharacterized protein n=1 Tax=Penaeus vannamei TaxID=6689 RepID=A0A423SMW9_PENVA|nr:hypothetical protein C7M84_016472 [Penaeus vannamei]
MERSRSLVASSYYLLKRISLAFPRRFPKLSLPSSFSYRRHFITRVSSPIQSSPPAPSPSSPSGFPAEPCATLSLSPPYIFRASCLLHPPPSLPLPPSAEPVHSSPPPFPPSPPPLPPPIPPFHGHEPLHCSSTLSSNSLSPLPPHQSHYTNPIIDVPHFLLRSPNSYRSPFLLPFKHEIHYCTIPQFPPHNPICPCLSPPSAPNPNFRLLHTSSFPALVSFHSFSGPPFSAIEPPLSPPFAGAPLPFFFPLRALCASSSLAPRSFQQNSTVLHPSSRPLTEFPSIPPTPSSPFSAFSLRTFNLSSEPSAVSPLPSPPSGSDRAGVGGCRGLTDESSFRPFPSVFDFSRPPLVRKDGKVVSCPDGRTVERSGVC